MIRTNLATRPFYNETAVRFWLIVIAAAVAGATFFNAERLISYSRSDTDLAAQAVRDETRARELQGEAVRLRGSIDSAQIEATRMKAQVANELIGRRTFSWTELFNRLETTLPTDVRIRSLRRNIDAARGTVITIGILAQSVEDINEFMEQLEGTSAFADLLVSEERVSDSGQLEAILKAVYRPSRVHAAAGPGTGAP